MKSLLSIYTAAGSLLLAAPALASAPSGWTSGFERLLTTSYVSKSTKLDGVKTTSSEFRFGLGTVGGDTYSLPRITLEYAWESGLSLGFAVSVLWSHAKAPDGTKGWTNVSVTEPRAGFYFALGNDFALWPRLGITWLDVDGPGHGNDYAHTALTAELPLVRFRNPLLSY